MLMCLLRVLSVVNYVNIFTGLMVFIGIIGAVIQNYIMLFISFLSIMTIQSARYWNKHIFDKLVINRYFSQDKVETGKNLNYIIEIENQKFIPIIAMKVVSSMSPEIKFVSDKLNFVNSSLNVRFRDVFTLKWYEKVKRKYTIMPIRRGLHGVFSANLEYYDPLGFYENHQEDGTRVNLFVYPRILPVQLPTDDYSTLHGSNPVQGWIYQDRLNKVGTRSYSPNDSFRQINWKASARSLELKSNICRPSFDKEVHIFHGLSSGKNWSVEGNFNLLELSLICSASFCDYYIKKNFRVAFYSNFYELYRKKEDITKINPAGGSEQLELIYKKMALLKNNSKYKLTDLLKNQKDSIAPGTTVLIITEELDDKMKLTLNYIKKMYNLVLVIITNFNNENIKSMAGVKTFYLREEKWNEIKKIKLYN